MTHDPRTSMQLLELTIDNNSPAIFYSPFRDTLSAPNLTTGWNPYYSSSGFASSIGQLGIGESSHVTSMDGAYCSLKWHGNGIRLSGNANLSSYSITLDGADVTPNVTSFPNQILVDIYDLQDGDHTISLTARMPQNSSILGFDEAVVRTYGHGATQNSIFSQQILDRNAISFNGRWTFEPMASGQTYHTSTTAGDRANASFNGTALILRGMITPSAANYSVTLDGVTTTLCAQSSFTVPNTTLFFATGLNDSVIHSIEVTNNGGNFSLLENGFEIFSGPPSRPASAPPSNSPLAPGTIASFALAGVLFAFLATAALFYCFIWRKDKRKQNDLQKWDEQRYMVSPGIDGSQRSSWPFGRRTRTSYDIASYGAKVDTMTLESGLDAVLEVTKSPRSGRNGVSLWQTEAADGNSEAISLPILFKHSANERARSPEVEEFEPKHPYSTHSPTYHWDGAADPKETSTQADKDLETVALANLRNKGKARQITGAASMTEEMSIESERLSWSPNLLQGLHIKMNSWSRTKTPQGSVSLSLNPSTSSVRGHSRLCRNSDIDRLSSFQAASNPSIRPGPRPFSPKNISPDSTKTPSLPSFPRSVSDSNTITDHPRQNSRRHLLEELDEGREKDEEKIDYEPLPPPPPHAYRNTRDSIGVRQSVPNSLSLYQVALSLSPRVSGVDPDGNHYTNPGIYAETLTEEQDEEQSLSAGPSGRHVQSPVHLSTPVVHSATLVPPSETPIDGQGQDDTNHLSTEAKLDTTKLGSILPSLRRTSPFNIKFDWQSERESIRHPSKKSRRASESSKLRTPIIDSHEDVVQGTSRSRFRLSPSTINHPASMFSYAPSQMSTDVVTSFLDFTNSSEDSSIRIHPLSAQSESRTFGEPSVPPASSNSRRGPMAELKSRWSDTTASTRRRDSSSREGNTSSSTDKSSRQKIHHRSIITPSIYVTSEIPSKKPGQRKSDSTQFSTENPLHVHPSLSDTDSLPSHRHVAPDTLFRASGSDESSAGTNSRRTTDSSNQFHTRLLLASRYPPLPEGTDEASTSSVVFPQPPLPDS